MTQNISIALHGGAGTLLKGQMTLEKENAYKKALKTALDKGYEVLENKKDALVAVEVAVRILEDSPLFNAGKGSVFNHEGIHEMDAAIMDGKTLKAGAVSLVTGIKNSISLARDVMNKSPHVFLAGKGAMQFAKEQGYNIESPDYFYNDYRFRQWQSIKESHKVQLDHDTTPDEKFGTVGAVACDCFGNVAAATSTGGMTNKKWGRIGDSPIIGSGTYADNKTCAVSCTGDGEYFIRGVAAYDVSCLMAYKQLSLKEAADEVIHNHMIDLGGQGGLIAVDALGNIAMSFNTAGMYRACRVSTGREELKIYKD